MTNELVSIAYILTLDELAFFKTLPPYATLDILNIDSLDRNIVRDATAMMSLEAKGFISRTEHQVTVEPVMAELLQELTKQENEAFEFGKTYHSAHYAFALTPYPLQLSSYRITIQRRSL